MHVRREVFQRDGGRCTFTSDAGHRCEATRLLELDHIVPVARGGESTVGNLRLRCRTHNQLEAERLLGAGTMAEKVERARRRPAAPDLDVTPWLRKLGFSTAEAMRGAALVAHMPDASLEARVRFALSSLAPGSVRRSPAVAVSTGEPARDAAPA